MSVATSVGGLFLPALEDPTEVRAGLNWVAAQFPVVLDQKTLNELTSAIQQASTSSRCEEKVRPACIAAANSRASHNDNIPRGASLSSGAPQAIHPASADIGPEPNTDLQGASRSPVIWLLDQRPPASSGIADEFFITGINISNDALRDVRGTLKPDTGRGELSLALKLEGHEVEGEALIAARARFTLGLKQPKVNCSTHVSGAFFTFRYTYRGQQRASMMYLTPSMIAPPSCGPQGPHRIGNPRLGGLQRDLRQYALGESPAHLARFHDLVAERNLLLEFDERLGVLRRRKLVPAADAPLGRCVCAGKSHQGTSAMASSGVRPA